MDRLGQRLANGDLGQAGQGDDLPRPGLVGGHTVERLGDVQLGHLDLLDGAVGPAPRDLLAPADDAVADPAQRQAADVG
jgi:hypothetical protein